MRTPLIICIGNLARGDDGVAHEVRRLLGHRPLAADATLLTAPDLDVAMASQVAEASLLVLVDAERREDPAVLLQPLEGGVPGSPTGHGIDAPGLLAITEALYGATPPAWLVSVAAPSMSHTTELSAAARTAATEAAAVVERLVRESCA